MQNDTSILRLVFAVLFLASGLVEAFGQVSYQASYHPGAGNPGNLNQETDFNTTGWTTLLGGSQLSNVWSSPGNIPFSFQFFGQPVTFFRASANGQLTFDMSSTVPAGINVPLPHAAVPDSTILCFWEAFTTNPPTGSNDRVETKLFGAAPNRQLWIRWHSFEWGPCSFAYVAVVLEESTNKVYAVDLFSSTNANLVTSTVGIQANDHFAVQAAHNIPLSAAGSANTDNSFYTFTPYLIEPYDMNAISIDNPVGDGCGLGNEQVAVSFSNVGLFDATGMTAKFSVDGGPYSTPESIPGTLSPGDTMNYTFSNTANLSSIGPHRIEVVLDIPGDNNFINDTIRGDVNNLISITTFPYQENFENGSGGWTIGGFNPSWEMGYANNPTIKGAASGVNTWITGRTSPYNSHESSWMMSPCFDLTNLGSGPTVSMDLWWETEYSWDGAALQYSIDAGQSWERVGNFGYSDNWYNNNSINSLPGNQPQGWSGDTGSGKSSGGWVKAQAPLNPALLAEPQVLFRVAFSADGSSNLDGFAFDNFTIGSAPTVDLGDDGFFCQGDQLDVGQENYTHDILWSTGATTTKLTLINPTQGPIIDSTIWVQVTDAQGLIERDTIVMSMTLPPTVQINSISKVDCFGDSTATIDITMVGGASPFTYTWNNGAVVQDPTGLSAGIYNGEVIDINSCKALIPPITVSQNPKLTPEISVLDVLCHGDSTGRLTASAKGGVGPFTYEWSDGHTGATLDQLPPGTYQVWVADSKGCEDSLTAEVAEPEAIAVDSSAVMDASCIDAQNGQIHISISGGMGPYDFFWDHGSEVGNPDSLGVGTYSGYVLDSNQCFFQLPEYVITYTDSVPEAHFGYGMAGAMVGFKDSSRAAATWFWDFGDSTTSTDPEPVHQYAENGLFVVTLIVNNACGSDTSTVEVNIISASLADNLVNVFTLYPNPSTGSFTIEPTVGWNGRGALEVYHINGQKVWSEQVMLNSYEPMTVTLPATFARGLYLVALRQGDRRMMRKLELK